MFKKIELSLKKILLDSSSDAGTKVTSSSVHAAIV